MKESSLPKESEDDWMRYPSQAGAFVLTRKVDGESLPGIVVSYQIARHMDTPDDFYPGLSLDAISAAVHDIVNE